MAIMANWLNVERHSNLELHFEILTSRRKQHGTKDTNEISRTFKESEEKSVESAAEETTEGKSQHLEGSTVESELGKEENKSKLVEDESNPVLHYWKDNKCQPLVHPSDATSLGQ